MGWEMMGLPGLEWMGEGVGMEVYTIWEEPAGGRGWERDKQQGKSGICIRQGEKKGTGRCEGKETRSIERKQVNEYGTLR